jgi:hypothetical protein
MMETEETKQSPLQDGHDLVVNEGLVFLISYVTEY